MTNLSFLLSGDNETGTGSLESLSSSNELLLKLCPKETITKDDKDEYYGSINELCVAKWDTEDGATWDIGYIKEINEGETLL